MTPEEINEAVARKLGWEQIQRKLRNGHPSDVLEGVRIAPGLTCPMYRDIPDYSGSIAAAWEVVEQVFTSFYLSWDETTETWFAKWDNQHRCEEDCRYKAAADEAPMAICLAFLRVP